MHGSKFPGFNLCLVIPSNYHFILLRLRFETIAMHDEKIEYLRVFFAQIKFILCFVIFTIYLSLSHSFSGDDSKNLFSLSLTQWYSWKSSFLWDTIAASRAFYHQQNNNFLSSFYFLPLFRDNSKEWMKMVVNFFSMLKIRALYEFIWKVFCCWRFFLWNWEFIIFTA